MSCEITPTGECVRSISEQYRCNNCLRSRLLTQGAVKGGGFVLISSSVDETAAVYNEKDGSLVMEIKNGRLRKRGNIGLRRTS